MNKNKISEFEKIKIFLNEYYFGYGFYYTILRLIAGPLILIMGIHMYSNGNSEPGLTEPKFLILFGLYYILQPIIRIVTKKEWFKNFDLDYTITPEKIIVKSAMSKSELDFSEFTSISKRKTYFVFKFKSKQGICIPLSYLDENEIDILNELKIN